MKREFQIPVTATITAYGVVSVLAESLEQACQIVSDDIQVRGWSSDAWQEADFTPDWETAENLRVDDVELENGAIFRG